MRKVVSLIRIGRQWFKCIKSPFEIGSIKLAISSSYYYLYKFTGYSVRQSEVIVLSQID